MTGAVAGGPPPASGDGRGKRRSPMPSRAFVAAIAVACAGTLLAGLGYAAAHDRRAGRDPRPGQAGRDGAGQDRAGQGQGIQPPGGLDLAAVDEILDRRARAVRERDRAGFLADVDPAFRRRQREVFDNLARLPLATWRQRAESADPAAAGGRAAWTVRVALRYRLRGFDHMDAAAAQYLTFARRAGAGRGLVLIDDGAPQGLVDDPQIWDGGQLTVVHGGRSLVIGAGAPRARLRQIAARLDRAVPAVTAVVGPDWGRRAVAIVPATAERAAALAGGGQSLRDIAALATVTPGAGGAPGADRILVSPDSYPKLNEIGRHVVLTHELTHVATHGAADARTPVWLIEGLADYVGYKGLDVPVTSAARELRREVAKGRLPAALPGRADFAGAAGRLPQAYEEAWLACRMVAGRYGEDRLVRLYREAGRAGAAAGPDAFSRVARRVLGVDGAEFTALWRRYLTRELG
jgi:hypothetical protein